MAEGKIVSIFSAGNMVEASAVMSALESEGIRATIDGEYLSGAVGELPLGEATSPRLLVAERDAARARNIVKRYQSGSPGLPKSWRCGDCGKRVPSTFDVCWKCGSAHKVFEPETKPQPTRLRPKKQPPPRLTRTTPHTLTETIAVVCLGVVAHMLIAIASFAYEPRDHEAPWAFAFEYVGTSLAVVVPVLYLMSRDRRSFEFFGVRRLRLFLDPIVALAIWMVCLACVSFAVNVTNAFLPTSLIYDWPDHSGAIEKPSGVLDYVWLLVAAFAIGFSEELCVRAYLITRFEQLTKSTALSLVLSSSLFAAYHAYQGPLGVVNALTFGLVMGASFCVARRVWPIAITHALWDFVEFVA